jgi:hypothetical protein
VHIPKPILFGLALIGAVVLGWMLRVSTASGKDLAAQPVSATTAAATTPAGDKPVYLTVVTERHDPAQPVPIDEAVRTTAAPATDQTRAVDIPPLSPESHQLGDLSPPAGNDPIMYATGTPPSDDGGRTGAPNSPKSMLKGPARVQIVANGNHIVIADDGSIVSVGDNTVVHANSGDAGSSGAIGLDVGGSTLSTGDSQHSIAAPALSQSASWPAAQPDAAASTDMMPTMASGHGLAPVADLIPPPGSSLPRPGTIDSSYPTSLMRSTAGAGTGAGTTAPSRAIGIAGYELHSIDLAGDDNLVTYDDSNLFFHRIGTMNGNTGDTDTSGLNVVDAERSVVRSGASGNSDETQDPPPFNPSHAPYAIGMPTASTGKGASGAVQVADINGVSTALAQDSLVIGGDGMDDNGVRINGSRNVATYDDGNVAIGGIGDVNAQIGDSDTSGTVAMRVRDSHIEAGGSFLPAWQQAGAQVGDPFDGNDPDITDPGTPADTTQIGTR